MLKQGNTWSGSNCLHISLQKGLVPSETLSRSVRPRSIEGYRGLFFQKYTHPYRTLRDNAFFRIYPPRTVRVRSGRFDPISVSSVFPNKTETILKGPVRETVVSGIPIALEKVQERIKVMPIYEFDCQKRPVWPGLLLNRMEVFRRAVTS
jgi:hypothetical protein